MVQQHSDRNWRYYQEKQQLIARLQEIDHCLENLPWKDPLFQQLMDEKERLKRGAWVMERKRG